jgi:phosphatidylethanolamine/phosphatidyl-N-methylethanolamine N-methyltransferase
MTMNREPLIPAPVAARVYDRYSRFYDAFDWFFKRRLARAISAIPFLPGDRVLDVGIGTGLSMEFYPHFVHLTGIDQSAGMLRQAQNKLDRGKVVRPPHHTRLVQADALHLPFPDRTFEVVFLSHMISTVPDPRRCLAQAIRVAGDNAYIVLVNHFRSHVPVVNHLEGVLDPLCRRLGWRCDLSLAELMAHVAIDNPQDIARSSSGILFRTLCLQKRQHALHVIPMPQPVVHQPQFGPI